MNRTASCASKSNAVTAPSPSVLPNSVAVQFIEDQAEPIVADWRQICWSLDDLGPIHGVVLVERARTFGTKLIDLRWNVERLKNSANAIGLDEQSVVIWYTHVCNLILAANSNLVEHQDVSVVVLFSPIELNGTLRWKSIAYLAPIPSSRLSSWYQNGCQIQTSTMGVIPNSVFPTSIKHRSRIHYWLADRSVRNTTSHNVAVLMDTEKRIGDSSIANLLFVDCQRNWFTPDPEYAHHGTTLKQSMELLREIGIVVQTRPVEYQEAIACQEIILVGSTGVAWSASSIDLIALPDNRTNCQRLQSLWIQYLQYDFRTC
ncbi:MAG: aminotransferase class IV [Pirellula sp.]|jgi:branched-subunit amino acid aminotransferase/4-amino-4-deoxychorismate lyase